MRLLPWCKMSYFLSRTSWWRKMSKSLGNVIEPNEVIRGITLPDLQKKLEEGNLHPREIEKAKAGQKADFPDGIPQCGGDALRFGLLAYTQQGRSINLDINRVVAYRHFCNKLWNVAKFALGNFPEGYKPIGVQPTDKFQFEDEWIMSRFARAMETTNKGFRSYLFADATTALYNFWLHDLSDVYLEGIKRRMATEDESKRVALEVLFMCLDRGLRALHPLLPFVTEELYQRLPVAPWKSESICIAQYPTECPTWVNPKVEESMENLQKVCAGFRSLAASVSLHPRERPAAFLRHKDPSVVKVLVAAEPLLLHLGKVGSFTVLEAGKDPSGSVASVVNDQCSVYLQVAALVDLGKEADKQEKKLAAAEKALKAEIEELKKSIKALRAAA